MELKNPIALYICAGVAAAFVIATFITIKMKRKFKGGKKAFLPEYLSFDVVPEVVGPDCEGVMRISYSPSSREPRKDVRLILKGLGVPPSQSVINIKIE